ncbi:MAG: sodium:proton antiporter [Rhodobiaceae bacterium]|nr:MAG: sodium:proton antiporter [Rhodobiaceae bacterium]
MMDLALDIASWVSFALGAFFLIVGAVGMIRLPDFWSRLHGAGIIDTAGAELILLGMAFQAGLTQTTIKLALIGLFLFLTSPTGTHAVANAAHVAGLRPLGQIKDDEKPTTEGDAS